MLNLLEKIEKSVQVEKITHFISEKNFRQKTSKKKNQKKQNGQFTDQENLENRLFHNLTKSITASSFSGGKNHSYIVNWHKVAKRSTVQVNTNKAVILNEKLFLLSSTVILASNRTQNTILTELKLWWELLSLRKLFLVTGICQWLAEMIREQKTANRGEVHRHLKKHKTSNLRAID